MAKAVRQLASRRVVGNAMLGMHGNGRGSVKQQVHDGDTITVEASGNLGVRFLGTDTPEISFTLPGENVFRPTDHPDWAALLSDPLAGAPQDFLNSLGPALQAHIVGLAHPDAAVNHHEYAEAAEDLLEQMVQDDMDVLGKTKDDFGFFLSFSHEVMDGYGRFLCFINRDQASATDPEPRPLSYNERMLQSGLSAPYFIWPNVNPFRPALSILNAVPDPAGISQVADGAGGLGPAREWVRQARNAGQGIYAPADPLRVQPFELRYLSRRRAPSRWVIDLTGQNAGLIRPVDYHVIPNEEDRLFIPAEYVPLFVEQGWQRN